MIDERERTEIDNMKVGIIQKYLCCLLILLLWNCTSNPIKTENEISKNTIRGAVVLSDFSSPRDVFVWFKVFNISTRTDENGNFELNLPPAAEQGGGGVDGIYGLYFYMANYQLDSVQVALFNGNLQASDNGIKSSGDLVNTVRLAELLDIKASFNPVSPVDIQTDTITVNFTVKSMKKTVNVSADFSNPAFQGDPQFIVGFARNVDPEQDFCMGIYREDRSHRTAYFEIENNATELYPLEIINTQGSFELGQYEVIPAIGIQQEMPTGLLESLNKSGLNVCQTFFNTPIRVENNTFQLVNPVNKKSK